MRALTLVLAALSALVAGCDAFEGLAEGMTDSFEGEPFDLLNCEGCPEAGPGLPGLGEGEGEGEVFGYRGSCNETGLCIDYFVPSAGEADRIKDECGAAGAQPSDAPCPTGDHLCMHMRADMCTVTHTYGEMPDHDEACTAVNPDAPPGDEPGQVGSHCQ